ncbi:glycerate kinase [Calidifontibacter terrae]
MPRIVIAPDKFKGTLTAAQVAQAVARGIRRMVPEADCVSVPVADGGDGTLAAAEHAGFKSVRLQAADPLGVRVATRFMRRGDEAVIEMAEVSGLAMLGERRDPLHASSRGLGEVIAAALDAGCRRIVVGIGGSASTDGGAGMAAALGARFDVAGDGGAALAAVDRIDLSFLHPGLDDAQLLIACDVDNPLTGPQGAATIYGPQKGATAADVDRLDAALSHWADVIAEASGQDHRDAPGAGAAGGVGFAAIALLGGSLQPGASLVFELVGLPAAIAGADLVITGEGALDRQTLHGKAPAAVAELAGAQGIPTVAVAGICELDEAGLQQLGVLAAYDLMSVATDRAEAMREGERLLEQLGERIARDHL